MIVYLAVLSVPVCICVFVLTFTLAPRRWFGKSWKQKSYEAWKQFEEAIVEATEDHDKRLHEKSDVPDNYMFTWNHGYIDPSSMGRKFNVERNWGAYSRRFKSEWNNDNAQDIRPWTTGTVEVSWLDVNYIGINKIITAWTERQPMSKYQGSDVYNEANAFYLFGRVCFTIKFHDIPNQLDLMMFKRRFFRKTCAQTSNLKFIPILSADGAERCFMVIKKWDRNNGNKLFLERQRLREVWKKKIDGKPLEEEVSKKELQKLRERERHEMHVMFYETYEGDAAMKEKLNQKGKQLDIDMREREKNKRTFGWAITYGDICRRTHGYELYVCIHNNCVTFTTIRLPADVLKAKESGQDPVMSLNRNQQWLPEIPYVTAEKKIVNIPDPN